MENNEKLTNKDEIREYLDSVVDKKQCIYLSSDKNKKLFVRALMVQDSQNADLIKIFLLNEMQLSTLQELIDGQLKVIFPTPNCFFYFFIDLVIKSDNGGEFLPAEYPEEIFKSSKRLHPRFNIPDQKDQRFWVKNISISGMQIASVKGMKVKEGDVLRLRGIMPIHAFRLDENRELYEDIDEVTFEIQAQVAHVHKQKEGNKIVQYRYGTKLINLSFENAVNIDTYISLVESAEEQEKDIPSIVLHEVKRLSLAEKLLESMVNVIFK